MNNSKRWNVRVQARLCHNDLYYDNVKDLTINEAGVLSFETTDGKVVLTTLPFTVEELK